MDVDCKDCDVVKSHFIKQCMEQSGKYLNDIHISRISTGTKI